jgi:hypothetical protein
VANTEPHHWLVAGVGRSGTTALYEALQNGARMLRQPFRCFYEPYLWGPPTWKDPFSKVGDAFERTSAIDPRGLRTHLATPLFITEQSARNGTHAFFIDRVAPAGSNALIKVIRGCGRLSDYLELRPRLKVVHIIRNPLDCVNSVLAQFSFFGDEFHPSDLPRFLQELALDPAPELDIESKAAGLWWLEMNKAALKTAAAFPDRVLTVPYEAYRQDRRRALARIARFLDVSVDVSALELDRPSGRVTSEVQLRSRDVAALRAHNDWYLAEVAASPFWDGGADMADLSDQILGRYQQVAEGAFAPDVPRDLSPIHLRGMLARQRQRFEKQLAQARSAARRSDLGHAAADAAADAFLPRLAAESSRALREIADARAAAGRALEKGSPSRVAVTRNEPRIACVITSFNNGPALRRALDSVRAQALPAGEIVIADDASDANSRALALSLQAHSPEVALILRETNLGPGLNRDLAIRDLASPFFTTLDGDDEIGPLKLSAEWAALAERADAVAFSDIAVLRPAAAPEMASTAGFCALAGLPARFDAVLNRIAWPPHNMLYARELYARAGGYDREAGMYEDWALKIRLAAHAAAWMHAKVIGLIYHRHGGGLSSAPGVSHCFWKLYAIHRNLALIEANAPPPRIVAALVAALRAHDDAPWRKRAIAAVEAAAAAHGPAAVVMGLRQAPMSAPSRQAPPDALRARMDAWLSALVAFRPAVPEGR